MHVDACRAFTIAAEDMPDSACAEELRSRLHQMICIAAERTFLKNGVIFCLAGPIRYECPETGGASLLTPCKV